MTRVLIIGYGNTLRGDDAAGVRAAEQVARRHPEFETVCLHQLVPELAEQIAASDAAFFLDADISVPETTSKLIEPGSTPDDPRSHFISPESLLMLSRQLYQRVPSAVYAIGIPASDFAFSESLSSRTAECVNECVELIDTLLHRSH